MMGRTVLRAAEDASLRLHLPGDWVLTVLPSAACARWDNRPRAAIAASPDPPSRGILALAALEDDQSDLEGQWQESRGWLVEHEMVIQTVVISAARGFKCEELLARIVREMLPVSVHLHLTRRPIFISLGAQNLLELGQRVQG